MRDITVCETLIIFNILEGSKSWICCRSLAEIASLKSARDIDACLVWVLCVVREISARAEHMSRRVLPTVFLNGCDVETSKMKRPRAASAVRTWKTKCSFCINVKSISIQITDVGVTDGSHGIYDTLLCINLNESKWTKIAWSCLLKK